jgi:hypothetical protein
MDAAVVGVAGTLLGGLVGGLLTHWNSTALARLEMKWQQARLRQEKLEEIAELLDRIQQRYVKLVTEVISNVERDEPFSQESERAPLERLRVLIEFYAPIMLNDWEKLERGREVFSDVLVDVITSKHRTKPERQALNGRAVTSEGHIAKVCRSMSGKAAELAHEAVQDHTANTVLLRAFSSTARR